MVACGVDARLAYHIGTLLQRSPVPAYSNELDFSELKELAKQIKESKDFQNQDEDDSDNFCKDVHS